VAEAERALEKAPKYDGHVLYTAACGQGRDRPDALQGICRLRRNGVRPWR
jgi:hypothetical protein